MTQPMPSLDAPSTHPSLSPATSYGAPPPLWSRLDHSVQRQLAQCLSDLIRRMRGIPATVAKEPSHDSDPDRP
jgi:hypothetical protein